MAIDLAGPTTTRPREAISTISVQVGQGRELDDVVIATEFEVNDYEQGVDMPRAGTRRPSTATSERIGDLDPKAKYAGLTPEKLFAGLKEYAYAARQRKLDREAYVAKRAKESEQAASARSGAMAARHDAAVKAADEAATETQKGEA